MFSFGVLIESKAKIFCVDFHDGFLHCYARVIKSKMDVLLFSYLGVLVGVNMGLSKSWKRVVVSWIRSKVMYLDGKKRIYPKGQELLKIIFPELFNLEKTKTCKVSGRLYVGSGVNRLRWGWNLESMNSLVEEQLWLCSLVAIGVTLVSMDASWNWGGEFFSVGSVRSSIKYAMFDKGYFMFSWSKLVPLKVNFFAWCAGLNRIVSKDLIVKKRGASGIIM
ncbi:hypothetical protein QVD17_08310 [Tagetes erecta]|uniref:Reverse transcriptase zinc-binding domain-containing protein n=1 Tax=Tagetes erecta TaxID=13708 RepID=A0AAD8L4D4_TARER|nr:hypothetical protein QVD17_08310 [Tagetes erecta]